MGDEPGVFDYVEYGEHAQRLHSKVVEQAYELRSVIDALPDSREKSLAMTKLEESVMWSGKALRRVFE